MNRKKAVFPDHLITIKSLNRDQIQIIFDRANYFLNKFVRKNRVCKKLTGKIVANLFFEPSTRTRNSFEIAAKRLGAIVITPDLQNSSLLKGESLTDLLQNLAAMGTSTFVIRHTENNICESLIKDMAWPVTIINAGDGTHQHPSQALIDLFTIQQHKKNWSSLSVSIIGDILHSRVARSLIDGLTLMNVAEIRLIGPSTLVPDTFHAPHIKTFSSLAAGLPGSDVIVSLRVQKERMQQALNFQSFHQQFGLTPTTVALAKPDAIVMHPGPLNRNVEIDSTIADGPQSVILQQVQNGVAIRMAILDLFSN